MVIPINCIAFSDDFFVTATKSPINLQASSNMTVKKGRSCFPLSLFGFYQSLKSSNDQTLH